MRKLTTEETELTEKGIETQKKKLNETLRAIKYAEAKQEYLQAKEKFEDIAQPIEREATKEKFNKDMAELRLIKLSCEKNIKEMQRQLNEGVEEKEAPRGVG